MPNLHGLSNNSYPTQLSALITISLRSILILSHLCLGLPKGIFPVGLPVKILKALLPSSMPYYMPCPYQSYRINHPNYIR